MKIVKKLKT